MKDEHKKGGLIRASLLFYELPDYKYTYASGIKNSVANQQA